MILDHLTHAAQYMHMHPEFEEAFAFIQSYSSKNEFKNERLHLNGQSLIAIVEPGQGKTHSGAILEAHRRYIDIQFTLSGFEEIGWKTRSACQHVSKSYNEEKDIEFFSDQPALWLPVPVGYFAIFFPNDAHAPLASHESVHKIIMKIAV